MDKSEQYVIDAVKKLRKEYTMTQRQLAAILGVSVSFIGNVENEKNIAKYNIKHVALIIQHFKVSPTVFFNDVDVEKKTKKD
jgi:transcriptional regulator with XRE-family HTH domain